MKEMMLSAVVLVASFFLGLVGASDSCPPEQGPCEVFDNGQLGYAVFKVNETDGTCRQVCTSGVSSYLEDGFTCGNCTYASCPDQPEPCGDFGNGFLGYSIHQISNTTGQCQQRCTAGNVLAQYLFSGNYTCGECPRPSCPEEPCMDHGNGWFSYWISQVDEERGTCKERCSVGNSLAGALHSQEFQCGRCPEGLAEASDSCPQEQLPCEVFDNGQLGYSVFKVNETDGTCRQVCTSGVSSYLQDGYTCGNCTYASCPDQEPCGDFGNGFLGYSIHQVSNETGQCQQRCTAGNALARYLHSGNYTCGKCPKPSCPEEPCMEHGNGWFSYWIHQVDEERGTCRERCSVGNSLASALHSQEWQCGNCPEGYDPVPRQGPSCPDQDPCKVFTGGWLGYSVSMVNETDGTCKQYCAASTSLTNLLDKGAECGKCTPPSCPGQDEPCKDFGGGWLGYSIHKMEDDGKCQGVCAAGNSLASLLHTGEYVCGKCPTPP